MKYLIVSFSSDKSLLLTKISSAKGNTPHKGPRNKELINYNKEFIDRIVVYKEKERESDVDEREKARYGSWIKNDKVRERYNDMMNLCKQAITQAEEVIFSKEDFTIPKELLE